MISIPYPRLKTAWKQFPSQWHIIVHNNLLLTEREGRTGEYWPEVVTVRTGHREVRTKTTEGQYSPVRLEQARLVSSLLYGTRAARAIFFQTHFRSVKFKGLPARDDLRNSERTSSHDLLNIFRTFYQRNLRLSFLDWEPKCGDNIRHAVLSSATGLESPKSLASDRASFLDSFWSIPLNCFHLFCVLVHDLRFALQY